MALVFNIGQNRVRPSHTPQEDVVLIEKCNSLMEPQLKKSQYEFMKKEKVMHEVYTKLDKIFRKVKVRVKNTLKLILEGFHLLAGVVPS